ncbi:AAA family ATPase [Pseudobacteriovorax antillogorgiicola]|uniref:DNA polymerase III, delta subunit n=1 Tax=Pseudobacteriovorax antillogorgiicola TaxID=1513793 RepID=A0A1Y6BAF1_9BACT|nr:AAA family ATPase [Pseudobacteriovorax antillogorgiicola]TCS58855.1 DNA polymerase III delta subunit-like protein [Pseudobacteriovorax antillogorgiicola]SME93988.1 DNA polymerase III, delta subunit [Pseudobacteriovorax antillogorgiicola]
MNQKNHDSTADWHKLVGFQSPLLKLQSLYTSGRLPQVLLFVGREGIGKRLFVRALTSLFYCEDGTACGQCGPCLDLKRGEHQELLWLTTEKTFKIEHAQQLQDHLAVQSAAIQVKGQWRRQPRVVVMPDIDRLNHQAANRMLKTLEEPNDNTFIIFTTSRPKQLLDTVRSRVIQWYLIPPPVAESIALIRGQINCDLSDSELERLLSTSGMAPGKVIERIQSQQFDDEQVIERLMKDLIFSRGTQTAMDAAKQLTKDYQVSVNDLAKRIELLLNQYYRWSFQGSKPDDAYFKQSQPSLDPVVLRRWRETLRTIRSFSGTGVPLNPQMLAETFALTR